MKIGVGTQVWIVIDNNGHVYGVWNSLYHAEKYAKARGLDIYVNVKQSTYLGGV